MTETMILDLADRYSDVVDVVLFTKKRESESTGADWYWCFETPTGSHHMLVQAKRPAESMAYGIHSWTVNIPSEIRASGKTQHKTLLDEANDLGVTPIYGLFLPGVRNTCCDEVLHIWPLGWPDDCAEPFLPCGLGFIHVSRAASWHIGQRQVHLTEPPGISLAVLVCCYQAGKSLLEFGRAADRQENYWDMRNDNISFDGVVARISQSVDESPVKGAVRMRVVGE